MATINAQAQGKYMFYLFSSFSKSSSFYLEAYLIASAATDTPDTTDVICHVNEHDQSCGGTELST